MQHPDDIHCVSTDLFRNYPTDPQTGALPGISYDFPRIFFSSPNWACPMGFSLCNYACFMRRREILLPRGLPLWSPMVSHT